MKFILKTDYVSNEYLDGTSFTLIELAPDEARRILKLRKKAVEFMTANLCGYSRLRVSFPGRMCVFEDYNESLRTATGPILDDEKVFVRVPDDFEIPNHCGQGRIELESLNIHHDGDLWLEATADGSGDYLETEVPLEVFELAANL